MVVVPALPTFSLYGKGLGPKYCGSISFLPSLENLVNKIKVQNVIFIFLIENIFPFNRSSEYFCCFLFSILNSNAQTLEW